MPASQIDIAHIVLYIRLLDMANMCSTLSGTCKDRGMATLSARLGKAEKSFVEWAKQIKEEIEDD